jgi:hypothetical protein
MVEKKKIAPGNISNMEDQSGSEFEKPIARSRSYSNSKSEKKERKFDRYRIFMLVNPRSGDGLAKAFLTDYPFLNTYEE